MKARRGRVALLENTADMKVEEGETGRSLWRSPSSHELRDLAALGRLLLLQCSQQTSHICP